MALYRIVKLFLAIALILSGLSFASAATELNFGVTPYLSEEQMRASFEPILQALSKKSGQRVNLIIARDYSDLAEKMQVGIVDLGAFSPFSYIEAVETASVKIFATQIVEGSPTYTGLIIARKDSGYTKIDQLEGKVFAFVDPKSASGFLYPRAMLIKQAKDPDVFFKKTLFAGSHDKVIRAVLDRKVDGGATYDGALDITKRKGLQTDLLNILAKTEPIPYDAFTARKDLPADLFKKVRTFFLGLSADKDPLKRILAQKTGIKFTGWVAANDSRYDVVRETAAFSKRKRKVATWKFTSNDKEFRKQKLHDVASEMLSNYLAESKRFTVIPQPSLEQVLFKYNLSLDDKIDKKALQLLHEKLHLDIVFAGKLQKSGKKIRLEVKGYNTRTADIAFSRALESNRIEELDKLITKMTLLLQSEMPLEAYIVHVNNEQITIDGGLEDGFKAGMKFAIVNLTEEIQATDKFGIAGRKRRMVGKGVFKSLKKDLAFGEIVSGDLGQIDVGSRIRTVEADESAFTRQNQVYSSYIQGVSFLARGANQEAAGAFHKALKSDSNYAMAHAKLSTVYFNLDQRKKGFAALEKAKALITDVTFQERYYIRAREATEKGDYDAAIGYYNDIIKKYPNNTAALHNKGLIYSERKYPGHDYDTAIWHFQKALSVDPSLEITRFALKWAKELKNGKETPSHKGGSVDIIVVFDTTGSMGGEIKGMIRITQKFADILAQNRIDFQLGLVTFGEKLRTVFSAKRGGPPLLTPDAEKFKKWLTGLKAHGGGDENPYGAMDAALGYQLRAGAKPIMILITDEPAFLKRHKWTTRRLLKKLNRAQATVFAVSIDKPYYLEIAAKTGGKFYNIHSHSDFTEIIQQIGQEIVSLF